MAGREERIRIFEGTRRMCLNNDRLKQAICASVEGQRIYWEGETIEFGQPRFQKDAEYILSMQKTVEAARRYAVAGKRVCILNLPPPCLPVAAS